MLQGNSFSRQLHSMEKHLKVLDCIYFLGGKCVLFPCNDETFPTYGVWLPKFYLELNFCL